MTNGSESLGDHSPDQSDLEARLMQCIVENAPLINANLERINNMLQGIAQDWSDISALAKACEAKTKALLGQLRQSRLNYERRKIAKHIPRIEGSADSHYQRVANRVSNLFLK